MVITRRPTIELAGNGNRNDLDMMFRKGSKMKCGPTVLLIKGLCFTVVGVLLMIWTPFKLIMDERIRMHRGLPPFEWWKSPPDLVQLRVRVFNYTNIEEFIAGTAKKLHVEEVGPIVYRELLSHKNVTFNDNSTITYLANHTALYDPELNTINLNDTILIPNFALLSMVTYLHNVPFFAKMGFNLLARRLQTKFFLRMTIQDFLWNFTDPILEKGHQLVPSLVPVKNMGMLARIYDNFEDRVTMYIGHENGDERFSLIDKFDGSDELPNYRNCKDKVTNATEGVTYHQYLTRQSVLRYWRKTICKVVELTYQEDLVHTGVNAYKYTVPGNTYDRTFPAYDDCYKGIPTLPNGLSDVSNCMWDVPIAASFPHFLHGEEKIKNYVEGLTPNNMAHESFVIAEPITGIPLESVARSQSNLVMRKLWGFSEEVLLFSDMTIPMFWVEYYQLGIPLKVKILVYLVSVIVQPAQAIFIIFLFIVGFVYVTRFGKHVTGSDRYRKLVLGHKKLVLEQEAFLKRNNSTIV